MPNPISSDHETTSQDQVATDSDNTGTAEDGDSEAEEQEEEVPQGGDVHPPAQTGTVDGSTPSRNEERAGGALRLIGIAIGQSMQDVTSRFQKPRDQYRMQDPGGAVTVYEYDGFTIGFNDNSRVEFIDVYSAEVDPILNGVRVGSTAAEAENGSVPQQPLRICAQLYRWRSGDENRPGSGQQPYFIDQAVCRRLTI